MNADPGLQFVDTNILVYAYDTSAGRKHDIAKSLGESLWNSKDGCLSMQVLQEFYVTVTRKLSRPIEIPMAKQIVADLAYWKIHTPEIQDILAAIDFQTKYGISFWDAMIIQSAICLGCSQIWSEDLNPGQIYGGIKVVNPFKA
jgi:predicted nucleic acid-binding protein